MDQGIKQAIGKQARILAQSAAKRFSQEPLEVVKSAGSQVTGIEATGSDQGGVINREEIIGQKGVSLEEERKIKERGDRILAALEAEMEDIRRQKELEQRERMKPKEVEEEKDEVLVEPTPKRSRKFMSGIKGQLSRLQRKTESRLPPTG